METSIDCFLQVDEQDSNQKTYAEIDGTLLVNQEGEFFGKTIDGELNVVRNVVGACLDTSQSIRMTISIGGEDVTDSLIEGIMITHNKNYISTFSLVLGDPKYSPLVDSNIAINAEVIIIVFINGQEMRLFTGLVDTTDTDYDGGYKLNIKGRGYGKKLLEKTMTLISIEQSANRKYRGSLIEYIAEQGEITNVDIPIGDAIGIDHSFQDQSLWDMIQKECAIEGWYVRFDENGKMIVKTSSKKSTADWEYGEDKFEELGLETNDRGIINKVTILGAIWEEEIITQDNEDEDWTSEIEPGEETYDKNTVTIQKSFVAGESVLNWSYEDSDFKVTTNYLGLYLGQSYTEYEFIIEKLNADLTIDDVLYSISGGDCWIPSSNNNGCKVYRGKVAYVWSAFDITITIKTSEQTGGGVEELEEENPEETFTTEIIRHQVKATVVDVNSIALYGERKPNNEGTLQYPLAETEEQCKRVGENVIIESHRFIKQPDYLIAFNPKLVVGCTVKLTDNAIGYDEEWVVEEVVHMINIGSKGEMKARTRIGCVYYA